jgi:phosphatidylserine/phosphatidylglycerophosphate/cardiolipin synthase-like enzyme
LIALSPRWFFVLPAILLGAAAEVHYGPGEDMERSDVALIREAAKQIDVAAYVLTDSAVIGAPREAAARGVKVRVGVTLARPRGYLSSTCRRSSADAFRASRFGQARQAGNSCT